MRPRLPEFSVVAGAFRLLSLLQYWYLAFCLVPAWNRILLLVATDIQIAFRICGTEGIPHIVLSGNIPIRSNISAAAAVKSHGHVWQIQVRWKDVTYSSSILFVVVHSNVSVKSRAEKMTTSIFVSFKSSLCPTVQEIEVVPKRLVPRSKLFSWEKKNP